MKIRGGLPVTAVKLFMVLIIMNAGFFYWQNPISLLLQEEQNPLNPLASLTLRRSRPLSRGNIEIARAEEQPAVVINEIAWMGGLENANGEWIELKNNTGEIMDLSGWKLAASDGIPNISLNKTIEANGYCLLERTNDDTVPAIAADMIYVGALGNSGEKLILTDSAGNMVDQIDASGGWPAGDNAGKLTMERDDDANWHNSAPAGGTPKATNSAPAADTPGAVCGNGAVEAGEACDDGNINNGDGCSSVCQGEATGNENPETENETGSTIPEKTNTETTIVKKYKLGVVLINEFVSDPADNDTEWVEIYNTLDSEVDLAGWRLEEGGGSRTVLAGKLGVSGSNRFLVINKPKGNLNNAGDEITLYDKSEGLIDRVSYGNWNGNENGNAPAASDPNAVARLFDGYNTFNNKNDFAVTAAPTKGTSNIISGSNGEENGTAYNYSDDIQISEIFPNPEGADTDKEFIELYNAGERDINLNGWKLADGSKQKYSFRKTDNIPAKSYLALYRKDTKIALNNNADSVIIYQPESDKPLQNLKYQDVKEGWGYAYDAAESKWAWSETVTPNKENIIKAANHAPQVEFACPTEIIAGTPYLFDSSDIVDPDGDELKYEWAFGDKIKSKLDSPEHTYLKTGNYTIKLKVSDGRDEIKRECIVKAVASIDDEAEEKDGSEEAGLVLISELLPNPEGADEDGEWIELYNYGSVRINMLNWRLEDSSENKPYNFADSFWFEAGKYLVLEREETRIALNNDKDAVRLFDKSKKLIDQVSYSGAKEGLAYARGDNDKWTWTIEPTPGSANKIIINAIAGKTAKTKTTKKAAAKNLVNADLARLSEYEAGDNIRVSGKVAVLPGVLGTQFFYITGERGLQIYNYKKDFPALKIGDLVSVTGELSEINGEKRLKTKTKNDIAVISAGDAPKPVAITGDKLDENSAGSLVMLNGEVIDIKGSSMFLDDGTEEAEIYLKKNTGISNKIAKAGEMAAITGIASLAKNGVRVMPRSPEDVIVAGAADQGKVLGEVSESGSWSLAQRDKKLELFKYLLVIAGAAIVVMAAFMVKYKKASAGSGNKK